VRHGRLVTARTRFARVTYRTPAAPAEIRRAVLRNPLDTLVGVRDHLRAQGAIGKLPLASMAFGANRRCMTHRAVDEVLTCRSAVVARYEIRCVIGRDEVEIGRMARKAFFRRHLALPRMLDAVAPVARAHRRQRGLVGSVGKRLVAHLASIVTLEMDGVGEDQAVFR